MNKMEKFGLEVIQIPKCCLTCNYLKRYLPITNGSILDIEDHDMIQIFESDIEYQCSFHSSPCYCRNECPIECPKSTICKNWTY